MCGGVSTDYNIVISTGVQRNGEIFEANLKDFSTPVEMTILLDHLSP
jgi:hypothetical protein